MIKNRYIIIDAKTMEPIYSGLTRKEVHDKIGINEQYIYNCMANQVCYCGKYYIRSIEHDSWHDQFINQWQEITGQLKRFSGLDRIKIATADPGDGR